MAIDMGSNAIKFRVWEIGHGGAARQIHQGRMAVRLGQAVFTTGQIQPSIMAQEVEAFTRIRWEAEEFGVNALRAVGTSALREAGNSGQLIQQVRERTGIELEVLSDDEEARLIALGLRWRAPGIGFPFVLFDVGGGSSEVIVARSEVSIHGQSLPLGAVRLTEQHLTLAPPTDEHWRAADRAIGETIERHWPAGEVFRCSQGIGSSGTATTLMRMCYGPPESQIEDKPITREQINDLMGQIKPMTHAQIAESFGIEYERAQIILAGAMILSRLMKRFGVETLRLILTGVSDGLLADYLSNRR